MIKTNTDRALQKIEELKEKLDKKEAEETNLDFEEAIKDYLEQIRKNK